MFFKLERLRLFAENERGAVAAIFGLSLMTLSLAVGVAVDTSRAINAQARVQNVLDSASLAAARKLTVEEDNVDGVRDATLNFLAANEYQFDLWGTVISNPQVTIDKPKSQVTVTADVQIKTIAGALSGLMPYFSFTPTSTSSFEVKRIELAMVLDVTGSMLWSGPDGKAKLDGLKEAAEDIIKVMSNVTTAPGLIRVGLVPYSAAVNAGPYHSAVTTGLSTDTCVVERDGSDAYTDAAAGVSSYVGTADAATFPYYSCPGPEVVPLTDVADTGKRNELIDRVRALTATGATAGHIGAAWGWYMLSPNWTGLWPSASDPRPYGNTVTKAVLLMTDGDFNVAYANGGGNLPGPGNTDILTAGSSPSQAKQLCDNMKAEGVVIYSVAFMAPANAEALLKDCSGIANFYDAASSAELKSAFRAIADKLTSLRLSQ